MSNENSEAAIGLILPGGTLLAVMDVRERLRSWMQIGKPIGFSPWRDAEGVLWGYLTHVGDNSFTVEEISPTGQPEGQSTYAFSKVSYFDNDPVYAERLVKLSGFTPTRTEASDYERSRSAINQVLDQARETGEPITIRLRSEFSSRIVQVVGSDKDWVELLEYDDLMNERSRMIWRRSAVLEVRWRTASEEADEFLLKK